jgi:hypothetical protein
MSGRSATAAKPKAKARPEPNRFAGPGGKHGSLVHLHQGQRIEPVKDAELLAWGRELVAALRDGAPSPAVPRGKGIIAGNASCTWWSAGGLVMPPRDPRLACARYVRWGRSGIAGFVKLRRHDAAGDHALVLVEAEGGEVTAFAMRQFHLHAEAEGMAGEWGEPGKDAFEDMLGRLPRKGIIQGRKRGAKYRNPGQRRERARELLIANFRRWREAPLRDPEKWDYAAAVAEVAGATGLTVGTVRRRWTRTAIESAGPV